MLRVVLSRACLLILAGALLPALPRPARAAATAAAPAVRPVYFNTAFEGASLGKIEQLGENEYRLHLKGQQDARGRNRQATWFLFRLDDVAGRELTLRLTSFKGEYNDRPANSTAGPWYRPVFSEDGETWRHFTEAGWDEAKDEITVTLRSSSAATVWVGHVPPYPQARLLRLLADVGRSPHAMVEVIGRSVQGRELHLVTVTNPDLPDAAKRVVWLQARQHAWEAGTSFVLEGALRFVVSDDPVARRLRDETVFKFTPMVNPDSVAVGEVRFNLNGWDPNRHWDVVDLRDKRWLERLPEVWYVKRAILAQHARQPIDLLLNLHNTETGEYMDTMTDAEPHLGRWQRAFEQLVTTTTFDPSRPKLTIHTGSSPANTTNFLWREARVPVALMELRIGASRKHGRIMSTEDRLEFGRRLITILAEAAR
ncbi:MAG: hypothetical protein JNL92_09265 [Opitutaceae bacterium]|nr:hypothetical protein [Opitutaceae bacterium]